MTRTASLVYQIKDLEPDNVLSILYNSMSCHTTHNTVHSLAQYLSNFLDPSGSAIKKLNTSLTNSGYFDHTQPLFKNIDMVRVFDIHKVQIVIFVY